MLGMTKILNSKGSPCPVLEGSRHHTAPCAPPLAQREPLLTLGEDMPTEPIESTPERDVLFEGRRAPGQLGEKAA